ncbi:hypothetical protein ACEWY4_025331 [Coilia grayii]|uniref:Uncharacterized protein n=1 Tax=Coilia grayii TaxID=363190 RepID=A0ABD1IXJ3_9TELE
MRRMIAGLLESVWDLADTTGLRLVNHESMRHVWEVQQKHLDCLQDLPGVALYTKVGTLQKGGKDLDILSLSQRVLGYALVPDFTPPGKPTGKRIAAEYLLAQTNRGDLLAPSQVSEVPLQVLAPSQVSEVPLQVLDEEDEPDHTINIHDIIWPSAEIGAGGDPGAKEGDAGAAGGDPGAVEGDAGAAGGDPGAVEGDAGAAGGDPGAVEGDAEAAGDIEHGPLATETSQCDSRGVVGWRAVDDLAAYLVGLNREITALSAKEEAEIVRLYSALDSMDKAPSRHATGRKDTKGKTLPIPQSIVSVYSHIRQLLQDSRVVLAQRTLALVPVNNTTVSSWLLRRDKRTDRDMLLQGTVLPKQLYLAKEPLPSSNTLPAALVRHAHEEMTFEEP